MEAVAAAEAVERRAAQRRLADEFERVAGDPDGDERDRRRRAPAPPAAPEEQREQQAGDQYRAGIGPEARQQRVPGWSVPIGLIASMKMLSCGCAVGRSQGIRWLTENWSMPLKTPASSSAAQARKPATSVPRSAGLASAGREGADSVEA